MLPGFSSVLSRLTTLLSRFSFPAGESLLKPECVDENVIAYGLLNINIVTLVFNPVMRWINLSLVRVI